MTEPMMSEQDDGEPILMVIEKSSHCLSFYDTGAGALIDRVALPPYPHEFTVDSAQRHAYVGHYGVRTSAHPDPGGASVLVIDIAQRKLSHTIDCNPYRRLHGVKLDGADRLHVLSEAANVMLRFDEPLKAAAPSRALPTGGLKSHLFALSRGGEWASCVNLTSHTVTKISPVDARIAPVPLSPGERPEGLLLSADEKTLFVGSRGTSTLVAIDTETMTLVRRAAARRDPSRIYGLNDGRLLVVNYQDMSLSIIDPHSLEEINWLKLQGRPAAACIHQSSGSAFVSVDTDECLQVDLDNLAVVRSFKTKSEPDCCFALDGGRGASSPPAVLVPQSR
jgi:DNA-binding beta-propeller fold protein YncE